MKSNRTILIGCGVLTLVCTITLLAQRNSSGVEGRRDELSTLRATIRESEGRLKKLELRAKKSAAAAAESRHQAAALDSLMTLLEAREGQIAGEMISVRSRRDSLDDLKEQMTDEYLRVARTLYRRRLLAPSSSMLLMPEEHRRLALAERLFARYAQHQTERAQSIIGLRDSLDRKDSLLDLRRNQQLTLLADRREQAEKLEQLEQRYTDELRRAESQKGVLQEFINRKNSEAKQIEGMIARLVTKQEREQNASSKSKATATSKPKAKANTSSAKKPSGATAATEKTKTQTKKAAESPDATPRKPETKASEKSEERTTSSTTSSSKRARSTKFSPAWPVSGRTIVNGYGERRNSRTNTITFNPGVNIAAKKGSSVAASGGGKVSLVSWLPSYGTVVIVEHDGGWRTVYANLASANVSEGTTVARGTRIGTVGESIDGEYLHFEIWQDQNRFDPMTMLK